MNLDLDGFFAVLLVLATIGVLALFIGGPIALWWLWTHYDIVLVPR